MKHSSLEEYSVQSTATRGTAAVIDAQAITEKRLDASIARFLNTRPEFTDELRDRLAVAMRPGSLTGHSEVRESKTKAA